MRRQIWQGATFAATMLLAACGGGPDIDQVKEDFDSPSGSVDDKSTVLKATEAKDASNPALSVAQGSAAFSPGGALTSADAKWSKLHPANLLRAQISDIVAQRRQGVVARSFHQELDTPELSSECYNWSSISADGGTVEMDLSCTSGGSGTVTIDVEIDQEGQGIYMLMEETFADACYADSCVNGTLLVEMDGTDILAGGGNFKMLTAWDLTAKWAGQEATTKGGMRAAADQSMGSLEFLMYVNNAAGDEVTYVLQISGDDQGNGSLHYKGGDGELTCTATAEGGSCTGDGTWEWTSAEMEAAASDLSDD